jgi:hypothetical protein
VALHREWMIRAFAVGLAIATTRLIFFPALLITMADPTDERFGMLLVVSLAVAFVLHASVAELWRRAAPASRSSISPTAFDKNGLEKTGSPPSPWQICSPSAAELLT